MPIQDEFRRRLAEAVRAAGRKSVSRPEGVRRGKKDDSVSPGGLTKILNGERANPGIFTVKSIADAAGVTVGALLGETEFPITDADRVRAREFAGWLAERFQLEGLQSRVNSPVTGLNLQENLVRITLDEERLDKPVVMVLGEIFNEGGEYDTPRPWHPQTKRATLAFAAGDMIEDEVDEEVAIPHSIHGMAGALDEDLEAIKVKGDSMYPRLKHGSIVLVDPKLRNPTGNKIAAVYVKGKGGSFGLIEKHGGRYFMRKVNREKFPELIDLDSLGEWAIQGTVTAIVFDPEP